MAKVGMRRTDPADPRNHGLENHQRPNFSKNEVQPVPELQVKAKTGNKKAGPK